MMVNTEWPPYGQKIWESNISPTPIKYRPWYRMDWYVRWASSPMPPTG